MTGREQARRTALQTSSPELTSRLRSIISSDEPRLLICIPDIFGNLEEHKEEEQNYWRGHLFEYRRIWYRVLKRKKTYYNAFMSTFYSRFVDKSRSGGWFRMMKMIWEQRDVVLIEGDKSPVGLGNDLFDNVRSIRRILAPASNTFGRYEEILREIEKQDRAKFILLALGVTATVLTYDLHEIGFQAVDIGHTDIEYEWYLRKAERKIRIENKSVNQVPDRGEVYECRDPRYTEQIIGKIG